MTRSIIKWSAENRWIVLLATAALVLFAVHTLRTIPVDAIPDLSDTQVIVYSRWDRSPDIVEDQVTYPIVTALLGAPKIKTVRGFSDFGFSYVYVIFEDGTDIYWARSRVVEYLSKIQPLLPEGVRTELGPDATGVGWVFQYALVDDSGQHSLADLRTFQDWTLRYRLQSVPGVAEVATFGGFQQQYQVTVDPNRLKAYGLGIMEVTEAVRRANVEVGGRLVEMSGKEYMVRGRGYVRTTADLEKTVLRADPLGTPVLLRDVAEVTLGPEIRRGVGDLDGLGDAVGGIVVMRHGENARAVIERVRERLREVEPSLPAGVRIVTTYDRSDLIQRAIDTLKHELVLQMVIVSLVILLFLWHIPSAIVPILTIPISVAPRLHPDVASRHLLEHHVPRRHRHLDRRPRGRGHRRGRERLQEARDLEHGGPEGRLPPGAPRGAHGGGTVRLLLAPPDRGRVHPRLHAPRPGGAALQAARLDEDPHHAHGGAPGPHPGPRDAHALHAHGLGPLPARGGCRGPGTR